MGKEQKRERGRESKSAVRERERIRKTSTFPNISGALREHVHLFPSSCLNKGISAYQVGAFHPNSILPDCFDISIECFIILFLSFCVSHKRITQSRLVIS